MSRWVVWAAFAGVWACLTLTAVAGAFTTDEANYVATLRAARAGTVFLPGTDQLRPNRELYAFDPVAYSRTPTSPVAPTAPPLWAYLALPFSFLGWRGLVAMNALAFLGTVPLVYCLARRMSRRDDVALGASALFALGGYCVEYAQGVWPHMISLWLCTAAFFLTTRWRDGASAAAPLAAGLLVGLATGVRYQNAALAAELALGLAWLGPRRRSALSAYLIGWTGPLAACSAINHVRLGSWSPISKGAGYLSFGVAPPRAPTGAGFDARLMEAVHTLYAKVVDYAAHPPTGSEALGFQWSVDPVLGVFLAEGAVKKALLQSAPWFVVAFWHLAVSVARPPKPATDGVTRELRAMACVVFGTLALFCAAGFARTDGLTFNQRYFIELLPLGAVATAVALGQFSTRRPLVLGSLAGAAVAVVFLAAEPGSLWRSQGLRLAPIGLACLTAIAVVSRSRVGHRIHGRLGGLVAAGVAYAALVHFGDDLPASRSLRRFNEGLVERWRHVVTDRSALFVYRAGQCGAAPLHLEKDVLIADPALGGGGDAPQLVRDLFAADRRIFIDTKDMPLGALARIVGPFTPIATSTTRERFPLVELVPKVRGAARD